MIIRKPSSFNNIELQLPGSKSESNRALIIQALSDEKIAIENLSDADDTKIIQEALQTNELIVDCGQSGAALRFLCAYFSIQKGKTIILTGSQRLKERPLKNLIDALKNLGAEIEYLEKSGYAPIKIKGKELISHSPISIMANVSSQFISALLMIAPRIKNGLQLHLENTIISAPYIKMTMELMHHAKIHIIQNDESIIVPEQEYQSCNYSIEPDWSAASYWYAFVSLGIPEIKLKGFRKNSLQGDSIIAEWMKQWNVETYYENDGIVLRHKQNFSPNNIYDFVDCPDIAQTLLVLAALKKVNLSFTGVQSLKLKETNRIIALQNELLKLNVEIVNDEELISDNLFFPKFIEIETYHDHRMAMAFSLLSMMIEEVQINDESVVSKSYPRFWNDLELVGFKLNTD